MRYDFFSSGHFFSSYWVCNNIPHCPPVFHFEYEAFPSFADEDECLVADDTSTMTSELNWGLVLAYASAAFTVLFVGSVFLRLDWVAREIRSRRRVYLTGIKFLFTKGGVHARVREVIIGACHAYDILISAYILLVHVWCVSLHERRCGLLSGGVDPCHLLRCEGGAQSDKELLG